MRKIKAILLVLVATMVLSAAALAILIATLNDDHYRWIATRAGVLKPEEGKPFDILIPVLESVSLSNVHLTISDEDKSEAVRLLLGKLSLDHVGDQGALYVKGQGTLNASEFKIEGQFGSLADMLKGDQPYPVDLRANTAGLALTLSGT